MTRRLVVAGERVLSMNKGWMYRLIRDYQLDRDHAEHHVGITHTGTLLIMIEWYSEY